MDAEVAVTALTGTGVSPTAAARMVGYAALMQQIGREKLASLMNDQESFGMLTRGFNEAGGDPLQVRFPDGAGEYLEELVRSSYHPRAREARRRGSSVLLFDWR